MSDKSIIENLTSLSALAKAGSGLITNLLNLKTIDDIKKVTAELTEVIIKLQSDIMELQPRIFSLTCENADLKEKVRDLQKEREQKDNYKLYEITPQRFVYIYTKSDDNGYPEHYACANCFNKGVVSILQGSNNAIGNYLRCNSCQVNLLIDKKTPPNISRKSSRRF